MGCLLVHEKTYYRKLELNGDLKGLYKLIYLIFFSLISSNVIGECFCCICASAGTLHQTVMLWQPFSSTKDTQTQLRKLLLMQSKQVSLHFFDFVKCFVFEMKS